MEETTLSVIIYKHFGLLSNTVMGKNELGINIGKNMAKESLHKMIGIGMSA